MGRRKRSKGAKYHGYCSKCGAPGTYYQGQPAICIKCANDAYMRHLEAIRKKKRSYLARRSKRV